MSDKDKNKEKHAYPSANIVAVKMIAKLYTEKAGDAKKMEKALGLALGQNLTAPEIVEKFLKQKKNQKNMSLKELEYLCFEK